MRLSEGVEWAIHSCSLLALLPSGSALPTRKLAEYFDLPVTYLAKSLQLLSNAGIVLARKGPGGGYFLAKQSDQISLLDIVEAIDGADPCFRCSEIRRRGPTAVADNLYKRPCAIARAMLQAESVWREELDKVTLQQVQQAGIDEAPAQQVELSLRWFEEALR